MLRDTQFFQTKLAKIPEAGDVGEQLVRLVREKKVAGASSNAKGEEEMGKEASGVEKTG